MDNEKHNIAEEVIGDLLGFKKHLTEKLDQVKADIQYFPYFENPGVEEQERRQYAYKEGFLKGQEKCYEESIGLLESSLKLAYKPLVPKVVYVCSPYAGDTKRNIEYAKKLTRWAIVFGYVPITPHLYLPQVLEEDDERERAVGLQLGLDLLRRCDGIMVGSKFGITIGMKAEIELAEKLGLPRIDCEMGSSE